MTFTNHFLGETTIDFQLKACDSRREVFFVQQKESDTSPFRQDLPTPQTTSLTQDEKAQASKKTKVSDDCFASFRGLHVGKFILTSLCIIYASRTDTFMTRNGGHFGVCCHGRKQNTSWCCLQRKQEKQCLGNCGCNVPFDVLVRDGSLSPDVIVPCRGSV